MYWIFTIAVLGNFVFQFYNFSRSDGFSHSNSYAVGLLIAMIVPKIVLLLFMFGEDIFRVPQAVYSYFTQDSGDVTKHFPARRKFISQIALGLAAIPFASILYGIYKGKYNFKVLKYVLHFEDLPEAFDGYKLTQISDIHSGSFDNIDKVKYAVDLINEQQSDVILFTGDMVNNKATELEPYVPVFNKLKAKDLQDNKSLCVLIGPEGDFSPAERQSILSNSKVTPFTISQNILRSDTAVISAISLVNFINNNP